MNRSKTKIPDILFLSGLRINNSIADTDISSAVAQFGYTPEKLAEGKQLLDSATDSCEKFDREHGDLEAAFERRNGEKELCEAAYRRMRTIAGVALKNDIAAQTALGLSGSMPRTFAAWAKRVRAFYANLRPNTQWMAAMAEYGVTPEKIDDARAMLDRLEEAARAIMREKGDAQNATVERDKKLEDLCEWVGDYEKIAATALEDQPQLLEKLGIVVKE